MITRTLIMRALLKEHGTCLGPSRTGPLVQNSHPSWVSCSASASSRQVSGHVLLAHVAAVHGITACSHGSRRPCRCHSCWLDAGSVTATRWKAAGLSRLPLAEKQQQQHVAPQPSLHALAGGSHTRSACQPLPAAAAVAAGVPPHTVASWPHGRAAALQQQQQQQQHEQSQTWGQIAASPAMVLARSDTASSSSQPGTLHRANLRRQATAVAAAAGADRCSAGCGPHLLPCTAKAGQRAGITKAAASWHVGAGYSTQRGLVTAATSSTAAAAAAAAGAGALSDSWRTKSPSKMTPEEKHELLLEKLADAWEVSPEDLPDLSFGQNRCICPACGNGKSGEDCFAVTVGEDGIAWCCHRATCGYRGGVSVRGGARADSSDVEAALGAVTAAARQGTGVGSLSGPGSADRAAVIREEQYKAQQAKAVPPLVDPQQLQPLSEEFRQWFRQRGISDTTLQRNVIRMQARYCPALGGDVPHIAFPYYRNGSIVNIKYRALEKYFSQVKGGEQIFYGCEGAKGADDVIIVEGEMDKLAIDEALLQQQQQLGGADGGGSVDSHWLLNGRRVAVLSVPSGAPALTTKEAKYRYVHACSDILNSVERVILAGDSDAPGVMLADELARRIGREKCWRVSWPSGPHDSLAPGAAAAAAAEAAAGNGSAAAGALVPAASGAAVQAAGTAAAAATRDWARKDANEVLLKDGAQVLLAYLEAAQPLPIRGLFTFMDFWPQVYDLFQQGPRGLSWGVSTGWESVDACYKVVPGELTIVTGLPNSGKSEWLDALAVNLARRDGWRIALCSMENSAKEHGKKLMEKYVGKPFFSAAYSHGSARMDMQELLDALIWIDTQFHIIRPLPDTLPSIEYILDKARAAVMRYGIRGLVIDPYNELDHRRPSVFSETEHVSRMLTKLKRFAQHYDCHVWFVAHPRTQRGYGTGGGSAALPAPTMYDISGSANFINKADNGIVVHRPWSCVQDGGQDQAVVQLLVRKVRNKLAGKIGDVTLRYDKATGCYIDDVTQRQG